MPGSKRGKLLEVLKIPKIRGDYVYPTRNKLFSVFFYINFYLYRFTTESSVQQ